mgnify:CR=1 FL=1
MATVPIIELKGELRKTALTRRNAIAAADRLAAAAAIAERAFPVAIEPGAIVSGYSPLKSEIDPRPLLRKLSGAGARLA